MDRASNEANFMTSENVLKAVQSIKMKNAEGDDWLNQSLHLKSN